MIRIATIRSASLALVLAACAMPASAAVINFNGTTADDYLFDTYTEGGFVFTKVTGHYDFFGPGFCNLIGGGTCTSNYLNVDDSAYGESTIRLTLEGGGTFDLFGLDVLEALDYNQQTSQISACGGGCLVRSSAGGLLNLVAGAMTFDGAAWRGVDWIEFYASSLNRPVSLAWTGIDNINVAPSAVPAPPAAWLLATGLAGLYTRHRARRRASA